MGLFSKARSKFRRAALHMGGTANIDTAEPALTSPVLPALTLLPTKLGEDVSSNAMRASESTEGGFTWVDVTKPAKGAEDAKDRSCKAGQRHGAQLTAAEVLPLLEVCARDIQGRGLETLGLFRPWRLAESPVAISSIIDAFLRLGRSKEGTLIAELTDNITFASLHDVVAVFKWGLRHLTGEEGFSNEIDRNWQWLEKLKAATSKDAYSKSLLPLLPASYCPLLDVVMRTASNVVAYAEINGTSSAVLARILGFWLFGCGNKRYVAVNELVSDYLKATEAFELVFHLYLLAQDSLPQRLQEIVDRYGHAYVKPSAGQIGVLILGDLSKPTVGELLEAAFKADIKVESSDKAQVALWQKLVCEQSLDQILDDDTIRIISTAAALEQAPVINSPPRADSPTRRRSRTLDGPRSPREPGDSRGRNASHGPFGAHSNGSATLPAANDAVTAPSWSEFSSGGFSSSQVDLGLDKAFATRSPSSGAPSARSSPVISKSKPVLRSSSPRPDSVTKQHESIAPKITAITISKVDFGLADLFLEALDEPLIRSRWPLFAVVRLRASVAAIHDHVALLSVEYRAAAEDRDVTSSPSLSSASSDAASDRKRQSFLHFGSFGRNSSRQSAATQESKSPSRRDSPPATIVPFKPAALSTTTGFGTAAVVSEHTASARAMKSIETDASLLQSGLNSAGLPAAQPDQLLGSVHEPSRLSMVPEEVPPSPVRRLTEPFVEATQVEDGDATERAQEKALGTNGQAVLQPDDAASAAAVVTPSPTVSAAQSVASQPVPPVMPIEQEPSLATPSSQPSSRPSTKDRPSSSASGSRFSEDVPGSPNAVEVSIPLTGTLDAQATEVLDLSRIESTADEGLAMGATQVHGAVVAGSEDVKVTQIDEAVQTSSMTLGSSLVKPLPPALDLGSSAPIVATKSFTPKKDESGSPSKTSPRGSCPVTPLRSSSARPDTPKSQRRSGSDEERADSPSPSALAKKNRFAKSAQKLANRIRRKSSVSEQGSPMKQSVDLALPLPFGEVGPSLLKPASSGALPVDAANGTAGTEAKVETADTEQASASAEPEEHNETSSEEQPDAEPFDQRPAVETLAGQRLSNPSHDTETKSINSVSTAQPAAESQDMSLDPAFATLEEQKRDIAAALAPLVASNRPRSGSSAPSDKGSRRYQSMMNIDTHEAASPQQVESETQPETPPATSSYNKGLSTNNLALHNGSDRAGGSEGHETSTHRSSFETAEPDHRSEQASVTTFESFDE